MKTAKTASQENTSQILYQHVKRPRWGLAVIAWDHVDKRGYQFEDGKLRVFKRGFYRMLEEVDPPADRTRRVLERLGRAVGRHEAVKGSKGGVLIPLAEQIAFFQEQFPDGFGGAAWTKKMRGAGARKALKRHRDQAVERARELLSPERVDRLIDARQYDEVIQGLIVMLEQTSLVTAAKLRPLRAATHRRQEAIAVALRDLLHAEGPLFATRFDELMCCMGEPSWELATAPLALLYPERHVCVNASVFPQQAMWMAPRLEHVRRPTGESYQRYLQMALDVSEKLEKAGTHPRDLLDVHDFIYLTLRPAARKLLSERGRERADAELRQPSARSDREAA